VDRHVPLHYTVAQKTDPRQFHAGQVLVFHADTPDVRRHEAFEIVRVEPHQVVARTEAAHRSQGQSVDAVVIAGETMSRELFYVAASRGREHLTVITSDKGRLEESVGQSGARLSASELVRTMHARVPDGLQPDTSRGFARGIRAVVDVARQPVRFDHASHGHAVAGSVQQQDIAHADGHDRGGPVQQAERGRGHGISR
jgi:hypothetical protein